MTLRKPKPVAPSKAFERLIDGSVHKEARFSSEFAPALQTEVELEGEAISTATSVVVAVVVVSNDDHEDLLGQQAANKIENRCQLDSQKPHQRQQVTAIFFNDHELNAERLPPRACVEQKTCFLDGNSNQRLENEEPSPSPEQQQQGHWQRPRLHLEPQISSPHLQNRQQKQKQNQRHKKHKHRHWQDHSIKTFTSYYLNRPCERGIGPGRMKLKPKLSTIISQLIFLLCLNFSPDRCENKSNSIDIFSTLNFVTALNEVDLFIKPHNQPQFQHIQRISHIRQINQQNPSIDRPYWGPSDSMSQRSFDPTNNTTPTKNNSKKVRSTFSSNQDYDSYPSRLDNGDELDSDATPRYIDATSTSNQQQENSATGSYISPLRPQHEFNATEGPPTSSSSATLMASLFSHIDKQWKFAEVILIIVISAILNLVTIIGNIMVLISFKMDRSLQTVSNYFLLSLALADLLIGLISMPLYTLYLLLNYWPLGPLMCDIWLAIDYLNSNAAVLNMLIISFDRYFSVTRPLTYRAKRTTKHACLMISCAWILSLTIWTPAIFTYPYYKGRTVQGTDKCEIEFVKANTYLTFVTAILAFYIPVIIMIYLYWRIWLETKKRYRDLTTLFLVSGVGAAAPVRATRPLASKQHQRHQHQQHQQLAVVAASAAAAQHQRRPSVKRLAATTTTAALPGAGGHQQLKQAEASRKSSTGGEANPIRRQYHRRASPSIHRLTVLPGEAHESRLELDGGQEQAEVSGNKRADQQVRGLPAAKQQTLAAKCSSCCSRDRASGAAAKVAKKSPKSQARACNYKLATDCSLCQAELLERQLVCALCQQLARDSGKRHVPEVADGNSKSSRKQPNEVAIPLHDSHNHNHNPHHHHHHHHHHQHHHHKHQRSRCHHCHAGIDSRHHSHSHRHHNHHNHGKQRPPSCSPARCGKSAASSGKLSLLTSSYHQLLNSSGQSLNCASTLRKVHPTSQQTNQTSTEQSQLMGLSGAGIGADEPLKCASVSCASLACSDNAAGLAEGMAIATKADDTTTTPSPKRTVDTATSPIQFPSSPRASILGSHSNGSQLEQQEDRDFETRISSSGDRIKFESEDLNLSPIIAAEPQVRHLSSQHKITAAKKSSSSKPQNCKHCQQWESCSLSGSARCASQHHHHHGGKVVPLAGGAANKCCSEALFVHDKGCRLCALTSSGSPHNSLKVLRSGSECLSECRQCVKLQMLGRQAKNCAQATRSTAIVPATGSFEPPSKGLRLKEKVDHVKEGADNAEDAEEEEEDDGNKNGEEEEQRIIEVDAKLPILGALDERGDKKVGADQASISWRQQKRDPSELTRQDLSATLASNGKSATTDNGTGNNSAKGKKANKRFSQKLTFSDILINERPEAGFRQDSMASGSGAGLSTSKQLTALSSSKTASAMSNRTQQERLSAVVGRAFDGHFRGASAKTSTNFYQSQEGCSGETRGDRQREVPSAGNGNWIRRLFHSADNNNNNNNNNADSNIKGAESRAQTRTSCQIEPEVADPMQTETGGTKRSLLKAAICCRGNNGNGGQKRTSNRFSSNDSSISQKSSTSSDDSEAGIRRNNNNNNHHSKPSYSSHHPIQPKSERKAAKTLSTLLLVFIVTWLPYNVLVLIKTLSGGEDQVPEKIWNFSYYLCYINSTINPLCYALCNAQFRRTYMRILKCKLSNEHNSTRRLVPLQASTIWNKELRLTSDATSNPSTLTTASNYNNNGYSSRHNRQN